MGWWIALGILLLLFLLLQLSVTLYLSWGEQTSLKIGIGGFRYDLMAKEKEPQKEKKKKKSKKKESPKEASEKPKSMLDKLKEVLSDGKEKTFSEQVASVRQLLSGISEPLKKLLRSFRVEDFCYELWVGAEDAHQTAIQYAALSGAFYHALALLQTQIRITCKRIRLNTDFTSERIHQQGSLKLKLRLSTAIGCGISILWKILRNKLRMA